MHQQDPTHPTGVSVISGPENENGVIRARERKTNAALQLKMAGADWDEIAETLGYPTARAAIVAVENALERELKTEESQGRMRTLAGKRLERLLRSCWAKAIDPEHPEHLTAMTKAREIVLQHCRLYGLEAPTQMVVSSPTQAQLEAWVAAVANQQPGATEIVEADIFSWGDEPAELEG